jgi:hypothetical protein
MADEMADNVTYANASLEADLVMKGGITSGIVYPHAACNLARRYRFRNVGGTSAGAIAAAATAAAEYGRRRGASRGGFAKLWEVPGELAAPAEKGTKLEALFQPDPATERLFALATLPMQPGWLAKTSVALREFWRRAWLIGLIAIALAAACAILLSPWTLGYPLVAGSVAALAWLAFAIRDEVRVTLPANDFGLCGLGPKDGSDGGAPPLTVWLHETIQALAGLGEDDPLTFADLWDPELKDASPTKRQARLAELGRRPDERAVNLEMIATDLTHGRPVRLPIPRDEGRDPPTDEGDRFFIDLHEFERLFPTAIVEHLRAEGRAPEEAELGELRSANPNGDFVELPSAELPVIVATRMSLAFPGLISAVPTWRLGDASGHAAERVLISDGGITSNFPVHFFDSPLPRRPTFALNLSGFLPEEGERSGDDELPDAREYVRRPDRAGAKAAFEPQREIKTVRAFAVAIKDAMQNWRDNAQARLPGFRERVVHIHVGRGEGGLKLNMEEGRIKHLSERGGIAGLYLVEDFSGPVDAPPEVSTHWNDVRFTRYRIAMQGIEGLLRSYVRGYEFEADDASTPYPARVEQGAQRAPYPFGTARLRRFAQRSSGRYVRLVRFWERKRMTLSDPHSPRPPAELRPTPRV